MNGVANVFTDIIHLPKKQSTTGVQLPRGTAKKNKNIQNMYCL